MNQRNSSIWCILLVAIATTSWAQPEPISTLRELKAVGASRSSYHNFEARTISSEEAWKPDLEFFKSDIAPILRETCVDCHGEDLQEGNIRIDSLDPDLVHGQDVSWWIEILAALTKGEMPPADEAPLSDQARGKIVNWLTNEIQLASIVRRAEGGHSSFRRMTRYEYNYALQDLLGLPFDFAKDLPPESNSEDGFQNSSETLHMSAMQLETYREAARKALLRATVYGSKPKPLYWRVSMRDAAEREWRKQDAEEKKIREKHKDDAEQLEKALKRHERNKREPQRNTHYEDRSSGRLARANWSYGGAKYAWSPTGSLAEVPEESGVVAILPPKQRRGLIVELGDRVPNAGTLRVRIRASRKSLDERVPSLQLEFGWQASNDSHASSRVSKRDITIEAPPNEPQIYEWNIPLGEVYPRNSVRYISKMGDLPSPSEFIKLVNSSDAEGDVQIDFVEITAPVYDQWPPASHKRIFFESSNNRLDLEETHYAREVITKFMSRAWRRPASPEEIDRKLQLFEKVRPTCDSFRDAVVEVLATVLASPKFLYLKTESDSKQEDKEHTLDQFELATRLSMFLWCSTPDEELAKLAEQESLVGEELDAQIARMLADPRAKRFSEQFVRQWLGMQLLDYLDVDRKVYPHFDPTLKEAMQREPIAFFAEVLTKNASILDFLHADYTVANERLARHYGIKEVYGNQFRRVSLGPEHSRGGLLTKPGLLAMNSDGKDSHPLKRGIWLLERLLNDPPPPPPPAVPEIDLADPEIAKLTLKERIEDHRNDPACISCHAKIDPWGIAFEDFDAVGSFRTEASGKPVDSTSELFNGEPLKGMEGLKRYLLENRQDQFARAMVSKMLTYALGRPLTFADRSSVDQITADLRNQGDGLATLVRLVVKSDLFSAK